MMKWISVSLILSLIGSADLAAAPDWQLDGHVKYRVIASEYPTNSVLRRLSGNSALDHSADLRLNSKFKSGSWSGEANYQLGIAQSDGLQPSALGDLFSSGAGIPDDDRRLLDLTEVNTSGDDFAVFHRLDRLNLTYQNQANVLKLGRQAISWGNGLIYTPMDFFNPFDPAAIDTEYKPGDDMLYVQHLFDNADDLQLVWLARRDAMSGTSSELNTVAAKYHALIGNNEFDILLSRHFEDTVFAVGGIFAVGGSVLRGDYVYTDTEDDDFHSLVINLSYSWQAWNRNVSGMLEYFHNDFGVSDGDYSAPSLQRRQALLRRLQRRELFTLGRDYLAGSATLEVTPLWLLTPNLFYNLSDNSALIQLTSRHDIAQEMQLVAALSVPVGPDGSEFGGIGVTANPDTDVQEFLSTSWSLFAQVAWYF